MLVAAERSVMSRACFNFAVPIAIPWRSASGFHATRQKNLIGQVPWEQHVSKPIIFRSGWRSGVVPSILGDESDRCNIRPSSSSGRDTEGSRNEVDKRENTIRTVCSVGPLSPTPGDTPRSLEILAFEERYPGPVRYIPVANGCVYVEMRTGPDNSACLTTWSGPTFRNMLFSCPCGPSTVAYASIGEHDGILYVAFDSACMVIQGTSANGEAGPDEQLPFRPHNNFRCVGLRRAISLLKDDEAQIASQAKALIDWHLRTLFCGSCGQRMAIVGGRYGGRAKQCSSVNAACRLGGRRQYPVLDPSIMVLVHRNNGQECLLGRKPSWAPTRYSVLSGFASLGEQLEDTICREVYEESSISVCSQSIEYAASQFWAFPRATILVGFYAAAIEPTAKIVNRDQELEKAIWVDRDWLSSELRKPSAQATISIPGPTSLANKLILHWLARGSC